MRIWPSPEWSLICTIPALLGGNSPVCIPWAAGDRSKLGVKKMASDTAAVTVRDAPEEAASVLRHLGYAIDPTDPSVDDRMVPLRKW
jgi:hypothetical protein